MHECPGASPYLFPAGPAAPVSETPHVAPSRSFIAAASFAA